MKMFRKLAVATAVLIAAAAHADTFKGSYTFLTQDSRNGQFNSVQFTFDGTLGSDGNTITNLSDATLQVNGGAVLPVTTISSSDSDTDSPATASMDGLLDDFNLQSLQTNGQDTLALVLFAFDWADPLALLMGHINDEDFYDEDSTQINKITLVDETTQTPAVPEPSPALLLCAGIASLAGLRRMRRR